MSSANRAAKATQAIDPAVPGLRRSAERNMGGGRYGAAAGDLLRLARMEPKNPRWPHKLGEVYRRMGNQPRALLFMGQAMELYEVQGFWRKALAVGGMALQLDQGNAEVTAKLHQLRDRILATRDDLIPRRRAEQPAPKPAPATPPAAPQVGLSVLPPSPLFEPLDEQQLAALMRQGQVAVYRRGDEIISQGDEAPGLQLVLEGRVTIRRPGQPPSPVEEGAFFGEAELLTGEVAEATAVAAADCRLLLLPHDAVRQLIQQHPPVLRVLADQFRDRLVQYLLATHPLFATFGEQDKQALARRFTLIRAPQGRPLIKQGRHADGLYVLVQGLVEVQHSSGTRASVDRGAMLGKHSLLGRQPSRVTVSTSCSCWLLKLDRQGFREVIMTHPHVLEVVSAARNTANLAMPPEATFEPELTPLE